MSARSVSKLFQRYTKYEIIDNDCDDCLVVVSCTLNVWMEMMSTNWLKNRQHHMHHSTWSFDQSSIRWNHCSNRSIPERNYFILLTPLRWFRCAMYRKKKHSSWHFNMSFSYRNYVSYAKVNYHLCSQPLPLRSTQSRFHSFLFAQMDDNCLFFDQPRQTICRILNNVDIDLKEISNNCLQHILRSQIPLMTNENAFTRKSSSAYIHVQKLAPQSKYMYHSRLGTFFLLFVTLSHQRNSY